MKLRSAKCILGGAEFTNPVPDYIKGAKMDYVAVTVKARRITMEVDADKQLGEWALQLLVLESTSQLNAWEDLATRYYTRKGLLYRKYVNHFATAGGWEPDFRFEVCKYLRNGSVTLTDLR